MAAKAFISGCAGPVLTDEERSFFAAYEPWGLILFARNCEAPDQIRALCTDFRAAVGRDNAPVLIDQEGGRVQRLGPPLWPTYPAAAVLGALHRRNPDAARRAAWLHGRLIAADLNDLGITVDCLPVLDLTLAETHAVIGDRSFAADPKTVAALGQAQLEGLMAGGVLGIMKHIPGHGRATQDSHAALPTVDADRTTLEEHDFAPFRALSKIAPMAMTAHIVYSAIDPQHPATLSPTVIGDVIRGVIGFDGLVMTDDLSMKALSGSFGDRARQAFVAGCDIVLHCNGMMDEMRAVAEATPPLSGTVARRAADVLAARKPSASSDIDSLRAELGDLLATAT